MSFKIKDESAHLIYTEIWNKIKKLFGRRFHSHPIYDDKYIKSRVKTFSGVTDIFFSKMSFQKKEIITFV